MHLAHPLIEHPDTGDTYYQGHDLAAARRLVEQDREVVTHRVRVPEEGDRTYFRVELRDCPDDPTSVAEWGTGATEEEALRYAFGAAMGPVDAEYDEQALIALLQVV